MRKLLFAVLFFTFFAHLLNAQVKLNEDTVIDFADVEQGRNILGAEDDYVDHLSKFDLQAKIKTDRDVTKEDYLNLVSKIREKIPEIALSTDIIVGFPGETPADFRETLDLVTQVRYDSAFTFIYSPRKGTPAAELMEQVSESESKPHLQQLIERQNQISLEKNQAWLGRATEILVEGPSEKDSAIWSGRNSQYKLVHFVPVVKVTPGELVWVRIIAAQTFTLEGEMLLER